MLSTRLNEYIIQQFSSAWLDQVFGSGGSGDDAVWDTIGMRQRAVAIIYWFQ